MSLDKSPLDGVPLAGMPTELQGIIATLEEGRSYRMHLAHDTGVLYLDRLTPLNEEPAYRARFEGISYWDLLPLTAQCLLREGRFGNQTRPGTHASVLAHQLLLSDWFRQQKMHLEADWALVHDSPEAFLHDTPKRMKTSDTEAREAAIIEALNFGSMFCKTETFKRGDDLSAAAEAMIYGYKGWPFVRIYSEHYGAEAVTDFHAWLTQALKQEWRTSPERWVALVTSMLSRWKHPIFVT